MISDKRLWLTADRSTVVDDGDPAAAFLLCTVGGLIPAEHVDKIKPTEAHSPKPAPVKRPASKPTKPAAARK
jgi:hypothetical protein